MLRLIIIAVIGFNAFAAQAVDELFVVREPAAITAEADRHLSGIGALQDDSRAFELYQEAAALGDARAIHALGMMYAQGRGVAQDDVVAVSYFRNAMARSYGPAMTSSGIAYAEGRGVAADPATAYTLLKQAADAGDTQARDYLVRAKLKP